MTEGPYYTPNTPERTSLLEPGITGTRIVISGYVLGTDCQPIPGALVDFWQADDNGVYDNVGYKLRGHQFADASGRYTLETVVPGLYPGRTRHIHVKVQAPNGPLLTTQLFFPGESQNNTDSIFNPILLLPAQETDDGWAATFDFVVESAR
jgi:protocatechuate 3,4-dioxygenase beta subunit